MEPPGAPRASILLVDDRRENLLALEATLSSLGHRLVEAVSGEEALKAVLQEEFAVILLDVQMPGLDGPETARLIKQRDRSRHTPIIFLTAHAAEGAVVARAYHQGAVDYLAKPFDPDILRSKVAVFVELFLRGERIKEQEGRLLREAEQRVAREQAELQRANLHRLFMQAPAAIAIVRGADHVYEFSNPTNQALVGDRQLVGRPAREAVPEIASTGLVSMLDHVWRTGEPFVAHELGLTLEREPGKMEEVYLAGTYQPLRGADGAIEGVMAFAYEVTEQVRARQRMEALAEELRVLHEAERGAKEQAELASRLKDEFLAAVSHELRTPLQAILGWVQLLERRGAATDRLDKALEVIGRNTRAQARLVDDLLDVSRIVSGRLALVSGPVDLASVVRLAIDGMRTALEAKGLVLTSTVQADVGPISGDSDRLAQVVWNLLSNAVKFTPAGKRIDVRLERDDEDILLTVSDEGCGITPDFLPHVFDRFRQAEGGATRSYGGLGLGLAIVRSIVELHGGTVEAESKGAGQGASFRVSLPARPPTRPPEAPRTSSPGILTRLKGMRILVVEDEPDTRELLVELLQNYGAKVQPAGSVREAFVHLASFAPHVIVSDIGMPEEDGYALIQRLRALPPGARGRDLPAVALTAFARAEDRKRALDAGYQAHVTKPVEPRHLVEVIIEVVG